MLSETNYLYFHSISHQQTLDHIVRLQRPTSHNFDQLRFMEIIERTFQGPTSQSNDGVLTSNFDCDSEKPNSDWNAIPDTKRIIMKGKALLKLSDQVCLTQTLQTAYSNQCGYRVVNREDVASVSEGIRDKEVRTKLETTSSIPRIFNQKKCFWVKIPLT